MKNDRQSRMRYVITYIVIGILVSVPLYAGQEPSRDLLPFFVRHWRSPMMQSRELVTHPIDYSGDCKFFGTRGLRWRQDFADGSRLELRCHSDRGQVVPGYHVWFVAANGARFETGRCVFLDGINRGWFHTPPGLDDEGRPDHLVQVVWESIDGGKNDGQRRLDRQHKTNATEPLLDVVYWVFDPALRQLEYFAEKYEYPKGVSRYLSEPESPLDPYFEHFMPHLTESFIRVFEPEPGRYNDILGPQ